MNRIVVNISRFAPLRAAFRGMHLHNLYNMWLSHYPRTKVFPESGVVYRSRRTESVSLAIEILEGGNCYDPALFPDGCSTFADLGCNTGYFPCWLAHHARGREIKGLMVDANPAVIAEARWHVQANKWRDVHVLQGVVGNANQNSNVEFYVCEADTCSTAQLVEMQLKHRNKYQKITVPVISFGEEWAQRMSGTRCNVLKIDIEGCELVFLKAETKFLELVDAIFVEWHKYRVSFEELNSFLTSQGFRLGKIIEDIGLNGLALYRR